MKLAIENLSISLGKFSLQGFSMLAPDGSFTTIVGPSGSGKTTVLRAIAGLQIADSGTIFFGDADVIAEPPESRNAGVVFQGDSLFSHLNAEGNVAFGLQMKKADDVQEKVLRALELVHLQGFGKRDVASLSGGEKKRVAIARAIAFGPSILLLDEPFNGLDARLKEKMKLLLKELQAKAKLTIVMVTHDLDEAFFLSDRIVVINNGIVEQSGTPEQIFLKPKSGFVREFISDYIVAESKLGKKGNAWADFSIPLRGKKGKVIIALKKTNYRTLD